MDEFNKLRIVHCFRSPVGGIFRHVRDLVEFQNANGHDVGILCDSITGGAHEEQLFEALRPSLNLGLHRIPMRRTITPGDMLVLYKAYRELKKLNPNILHAHGSKGGAYARIIGTLMRRSNNRLARLYCPHGGSIHYDSATLKGKLFFFLERSLEAMTDRLIFVSKYEQDSYTDKVGLPRCPTNLVHNGLQEGEFDPVVENDDAADFLYIGMMRDLKGPDLFIDAFAALAAKTNKKLTAHMVGDGPDKEKYVRQVANLNISDAITFHDAMPARTAFAMAKTVIVPSRAESMPYIVLEAIAAQKPIIVSRVGGIPEIFAEEPELMVEPDDARALETAMANYLVDPGLAKLAKARAKTLKNQFSVEVMARDVEAAYLASL
jgi:glycosyltransferase involved in cell wall biosynthesis